MQDANFERLLKDVDLSAIDALPAPSFYDTQEMPLSDIVQLGGDARRYLRFYNACADVNFFPSGEEALSIQAHLHITPQERELINDIVFDDIARKYGAPVEQRLRANLQSLDSSSYQRYVRTQQRLREQQARRVRRINEGPYLVRLWRRFVSSNIIADEEAI
jgi:hypothetical protein